MDDGYRIIDKSDDFKIIEKCNGQYPSNEHYSIYTHWKVIHIKQMKKYIHLRE